ncbi:NADP-dependent oxidoreductase [Pigmentiphaga aceris]|uniref:NADP-dependent oxidoreductase n=1 Tax=Pigmentiphaga aceris TaxID=1940612 RepID=A0A5C0AUU1_9BURK|nr:NADP-dependent oxidoreductase [Pigmentiphaga aceris]QEI05935.1 NADP-dependent oxidoreductase [Pigmentiphaga aceris]
MTEQTSRKIVLASRPKGRPSAENFRLETGPVPTPADGEVLVQVKYLSLDPYMRGRMSDAKSYAEPTKIGEVMEGGTVAEVLESRHANFKKGDLVLARGGWQTHAVVKGDAIRKIDTGSEPISTAVGVLGMPGFTAYAGLLTIGQPQAGETVVVAAATGPVGSAVGQIARLKGARAVGIAGGAKKCALLRDKFGFDVAIDHHAPDFAEQLKAACPDGIDVYFENVGGKVWEAVSPLLNNFARIPVCGLVAEYNASGQAEGPDRLPRLMRDVLSKRLTIRGFIQIDFKDQMPQFEKEMKAWLADGSVKYVEDVVDGLENAPEAFIGLLEGKNFGKLVIKVS